MRLRRNPIWPGTAAGSQQSPAMPIYANQTPLERAITFATVLFRLHTEFWSRLKAEGATAQLIVVLGNDSTDGFELSHEVMAALSEFGLSLSVAFHDADEAAA